MSHLDEDCLKIILTELQDDQNSLYSCILVNRFWCRISIPILWKKPFVPKNVKLYNMIIYLLRLSSKKLLFDHNVLPTISNKPFFNYISFSSEIPTPFINGMIRTLTDDKHEKDKTNLLEQEIYKLFVCNCKNIKHFHCETT